MTSDHPLRFPRARDVCGDILKTFWVIFEGLGVPSMRIGIFVVIS